MLDADPRLSGRRYRELLSFIPKERGPLLDLHEHGHHGGGLFGTDEGEGVGPHRVQ